MGQAKRNGSKAYKDRMIMKGQRFIHLYKTINPNIPTEAVLAAAKRRGFRV